MFKAPFKNITPQDAHSQTDLVIIDVREPDELVGPLGKAPGVHNIPLGHLAGGAAVPTENLATPVAVICQSGSRSQVAASILLQRGFTNVSNIVGGMGMWNASALPVERSAAKPRAAAGWLGRAAGFAS